MSRKKRKQRKKKEEIDSCVRSTDSLETGRKTKSSKRFWKDIYEMKQERKSANDLGIESSSFFSSFFFIRTTIFFLSSFSFPRIWPVMLLLHLLRRSSSFLKQKLGISVRKETQCSVNNCYMLIFIRYMLNTIIIWILFQE